MATRPPLKERYEKESDSVNPARGNPPGTPPAFYYSCQKKTPNPIMILFWSLRSGHRSTEQLKSLNNILWIVKQRIRSQREGLFCLCGFCFVFFFFKKMVFSAVSVPVNGCTNWNIQRDSARLTMRDILIRLPLFWWKVMLPLASGPHGLGCLFVTCPKWTS